MLSHKVGVPERHTLNQTFLPACSVSAFEYAGQSFALQELSTKAVTKTTRNKTVIFFIQDAIINYLQKYTFHSKNNLYAKNKIYFSFRTLDNKIHNLNQ